MKEIYINNEKIVIREAEKSDANALIEYLNTIGGESDFLTFGRNQFAKSLEQEEEFIENTLAKKNALSIIAVTNDKIVGNLNFAASPKQRLAHAGEFGVSVLKKYWGYGIGEELIKYLITWSKSTGIIRKINLRVRTDNMRGIHLYKKLGFTDEGIVRREFLIDGKFYDSLLMGLLID